VNHIHELTLDTAPSVCITQCICGNSLTGNDIDKCDLEDDDFIPEYKYL